MKTLLAALLCLVSVVVHGQKISALPEIFHIATNDLFLIYTPSIGGYKATLDTVASNLSGMITVAATVTNAISRGSNLATTNSTSYGMFYQVANLTNMQFFNLKQGTNMVLYNDGSNVVLNSTGTGGSSGGASTNLGVGQTIYLDASFGNDATAQRTNAARPFRQATNAAAALLTGDTLKVRGGTYLLNPKVSPALIGNFSGAVAFTNKSNFRITGEPGAIWQMSGRSTNFGASSAPMMILVNCTNVLIDKMTFIGVRTTNAYASDFAICLINCGYVTIDHCAFDDWTDQGVTDLAANTVNQYVTIKDCWFSDIGSTNHITLGSDGTAISLNCSNLVITGNKFLRNLRDIEFYLQAYQRNILISENYSWNVRGIAILLASDSNRLSDISIINNHWFGYTSNAFPTNGPIWMDIWSVSNLVVSGNEVAGFPVGLTYGYSGTVSNSICVDVKVENNDFRDYDRFAVYMMAAVGSPFTGVAIPARCERISVIGNRIKNGHYSAIAVNGNNSRVEHNEMTDCADYGDTSGVIMIGHVTAGYSTNATNVTIVGNKIYNSAFAANAAPWLTIPDVNYFSVVWGNESTNFAAMVNNGIGTLTMPLNKIAPGKMLYSDTNSRMGEVTIGSGVAFDGSTGTLTASGGGGGTIATNSNQFGPTPTLTLKNGLLITNETVNGWLTLPDIIANRPLFINASGNITNVSGTPNGAQYVRDDGVLATPSGAGDVTTAQLLFASNSIISTNLISTRTNLDVFTTLELFGSGFISTNLYVTGLLVAANAQYSAIPGTGTLPAILADGTLMKTNVLNVTTVNASTLFITNGITIYGLGLTATNISPGTPSALGALVWSDGTNIVATLRNSAGGITTNKLSMTAWP